MPVTRTTQPANKNLMLLIKLYFNVRLETEMIVCHN